MWVAALSILDETYIELCGRNMPDFWNRSGKSMMPISRLERK